MLNLLINLKNTRYSEKNSSAVWLVFSAFLAGAILFWLCGKEFFAAVPSALSDRNFCIAFTAVFAALFLAAFSQLGILMTAAADAVFEFLIACFAFSKLSHNADAGSIFSLCLQIFLIIMLYMLFSQRAITASVRLFAKSTEDKKSVTEFIANFLLFLAAFLVLLITCLYAF